MIDAAPLNGWTLIVNSWVVGETNRNVHKLSAQAPREWLAIRPRLHRVRNVLAIGKPVVFQPTKDRPVIGNSLNIAVVECQARFFTQRHKFFLAHINHDTGSGLFKPSIYVQDQDEDIWDASPNNLLGSWREKR